MSDLHVTTDGDSLSAVLSSTVGWALEELAELQGSLATADASAALDAVLDLFGVLSMLRILAASAAGPERWAAAVDAFDKAQSDRGRKTPAFAAANRSALLAGLTDPAVLDDTLRMVEARLASPKNAPMIAAAAALLPRAAEAKRASTT